MDDSKCGLPGVSPFRTKAREERIRKVLSQRQPDLTLVLANIHDPHNVSAIYRSCDAFGVERVRLYYTQTPFPALGKKTSASARKWVESSKFDNADELFADLKSNNFQVIATSFGKNARPLESWDFLKPTAIILGNEHAGVEAELIKKTDGELHIPMRGMIQSLNVSVAAAVILAEAARQRANAGFYEQTRLMPEDYEKKFQEWLKK